MKPPLFRALAAVVALAASGASLRATGPYLHGFDAYAIVPPPPAPGSVEDLADRDSAFHVYSARTPAESAEARGEHRISVVTFASAIGPAYIPGKFPTLEAMIKDVEAECRAVVDIPKNHWKRLRPYMADPARFSDPSDPEKSFSYPSSHSTRATAMALILADIFPARRAEILQEGREIGWLRVEAGSHTPLDIYAGRFLGQALARQFLADPAFQADLAAVKAEIATGK